VFFMEINEVLAALKAQPQKFSEKKLKIFVDQRLALSSKNEELNVKLHELVDRVQPYLKRKAPPKDQKEAPKEETKSRK